MRSPVIAFGLLAATVSPTLIAAAPAVASPSLAPTNAVSGATHNVPLGAIPHTSVPASALGITGVPSQKRADDANTAGGNARTGNTQSSDGGSVLNDGDEDTTMDNDDSSELFLTLKQTVH
jgi:hypothetical protein